MWHSINAVDSGSVQMQTVLHYVVDSADPKGLGQHLGRGQWNATVEAVTGSSGCSKRQWKEAVETSTSGKKLGYCVKNVRWKQQNANKIPKMCINVKNKIKNEWKIIYNK